MMKRIFAAAIASAFLAVAIAPTATAQEKKPTPQQQKMRYYGANATGPAAQDCCAGAGHEVAGG